METRSEKRNKRKKKSVPYLLILSMATALVLGFYASPYLMNLINQKLGGVPFEENNPWQELISFFSRQEPVPNAPEPIVPEPEKPIVPNQSFSVNFSSFSFWRLQLAFSNKREWALEEKQKLFDQGIEVHYEDSESGLILFLGPFLTSSKAEEQLGLAADLGYPDAFPVVWEWPEITSEPLASEDELYVFAKAVSAYDLLANRFFSDQPDQQILNTDMQNLINTNYEFSTEEQKKIWKNAIEVLQKGIHQTEDILLAKERIMLYLNDFRNMFKDVAKSE